jgi:hypothetical protein
MQSTTDKSLPIQRSFDQAKMKESCYNTSPRKSMVNLSSLKNSSMVNLKDKPRIPMIRDKSAPPNSILTRRTTMAGQNEMNLGKIKLKSLEEKYRKTIKKQRKFISVFYSYLIRQFLSIVDSLETPGDDVDSDGFELPLISNMNSTEMLPRNPRKQRYRIVRLFKFLLLSLVRINVVWIILIKYN